MEDSLLESGDGAGLAFSYLEDFSFSITEIKTSQNGFDSCPDMNGFKKI